MRLTTLALLISCVCLAQRKEISLLTILERAAVEDTVLLYENYTITVDQPTVRDGFGVNAKWSWVRDALAQKGIQIDSSKRAVIKSGILLIDCVVKFTDAQSVLELWNLSFKKDLRLLNLQGPEALRTRIHSCGFGGQLFLSGELGANIIGCKFKNKVYLNIKGANPDLTILSCTFPPIPQMMHRSAKGWLGVSGGRPFLTPVVPADTLFDAALTVNFRGNNLEILGDTIKGGMGMHRGVRLSGEAATLRISGNKINGYATIDVTTANTTVISRNDVTEGIDLTLLGFGGRSNRIVWSSIRSSLAKIHPVTSFEQSVHFINGIRVDETNAYSRYNGLTYDSLLEEEYFQLAGTYRKLADLYRSQGRTNDANEAYIALKDMETLRYGYEYRIDGGFRNWTNWRLNQLLRSFTIYGTNPADAIVTGLYVILIFGLFYFFFPSDWDPKSKKQLIADFRVFIEKNEHGYWKPFWKMFGGFMISMLNAITLSLNAFITLGFGNIPTHGVARYVCVLQGFIGWFLLSIFTVALINQALF